MIFPNNSQLFAGSTVRLSCTGYGIPLPNIIWSRDGTNLGTVASNESRVDIWEETLVVGGHALARSHLLICSTVELDSGLYNCTAVTTERQSHAEFAVTVIGVPPTLIQTPGKAVVQHS